MPSEIATYNGRTIPLYRAWTDDNGDQHPRNWRSAWSDAEIAAKGITITPVPPKPDNRFYWGDGSPKSLDDVPQVDENGDPVLDENGQQVVAKGLKTLAIEQAKQTCRQRLQETDWQVVRASEDNLRGVPLPRVIPAEIASQRDALRTACDNIETAINGAADHAAFMALYDPPVDGNGNPTGNPPISDWPEA